MCGNPAPVLFDACPGGHAVDTHVLFPPLDMNPGGHGPQLRTGWDAPEKDIAQPGAHSAGRHMDVKELLFALTLLALRPPPGDHVPGGHGTHSP